MPEKARVIRRRIGSVKNTAKITRTMEMVATSKLKRAQSRVVSSGPYLDALKEIMGRLAGAEAGRSPYPLLASREAKRVLLWIITADRGLCGAYNVNLIRLGREVLEREKAAGREVVVWVSGRKGIAAFRFRGIPIDKPITGMTDRPTIADARQRAEELKKPFLSTGADRVDRVILVWPRFQSLGRQPPSEMQLLPISPPEGIAEGKAEVPFLFEPSSEEIFKELLPLYVDSMVFRVLAESVVAEMIARRTAMKLATDNAEKLVKNLTLQYNKARQSQITMELADILGGSEALK